MSRRVRHKGCKHSWEKIIGVIDIKLSTSSANPKGYLDIIKARIGRKCRKCRKVIDYPTKTLVKPIEEVDSARQHNTKLVRGDA